MRLDGLFVLGLLLLGALSLWGAYWFGYRLALRRTRELVRRAIATVDEGRETAATTLALAQEIGVEQQAMRTSIQEAEFLAIEARAIHDFLKERYS